MTCIDTGLYIIQADAAVVLAIVDEQWRIQLMRGPS